jgi:uncharacterized membrane protein
MKINCTTRSARMMMAIRIYGWDMFILPLIFTGWLVRRGWHWMAYRPALAPPWSLT